MQLYGQLTGTDPIGLEDDPEGYTGDVNQKKLLFSSEQLAEVQRYIDNSFGEKSFGEVNAEGKPISGGYSSWWATEYEKDDEGNIIFDENGMANALSRQKAKMGEWTIQNDGEDMGWTDSMIEYVSEKYTEMASVTGEGRPDFDPSGRPPVGGGSGGRGGGGPRYVAPMREVIEDTVRAMLVALTGSDSEELVQKYSDEYESAHKKQWDIARKGGTDIDPNQVVLEAIRGQEDYGRIHKLRPEAESETRWISDRMQRMSQLGVTSQTAADQAIWLAQTGTNLNDIETGQLQTSKGRKDITLFNKIQRAGDQVVGQL
jgi:hypothetical protein